MYKRRIKIFMGVVGLVFLVVVAKLGHLQIGLGKELRRRYEESIRSVQPLPGGRGKIIDRRGRILAVDKPCRDFCLDYRFLTRDPKWIERQQKQIERAYGVSKEDARRVYGAARNTPGGLPTGSPGRWRPTWRNRFPTWSMPCSGFVAASEAPYARSSRITRS